MKANLIDWLLGMDNPAVHFLVLRDLFHRPIDDLEAREVQGSIVHYGPVREILEAQYPAGYWVKPGPGYSPKYRSTVWQVMFLAQMGTPGYDPRVRCACEYVLAHTQASNGGFGSSAVRRSSSPPPERVVHCLNGNLVRALVQLGHQRDPRLARAVDWQAKSVTGQNGIRYYKRGTTGPLFACAENGGLPCAWGAVKALSGFAVLPADLRTPLVEEAISIGVDLLLSCDPVVADYPSGTGRVSPLWFRLGFPLTYTADVLQVLEVLAELGYGQDPRLDHAFEWLTNQRNEQGRWHNRNAHKGRLWSAIDEQGAPSKWVTLRALRALTRAERLAIDCPGSSPITGSAPTLKRGKKG